MAEQTGNPQDGVAVTPILREGSSGPFVEELQQMLIDLGYQIPVKNGVFDEITEASLMTFQREHSIEPSGYVDETTRLSLIREAQKRAIVIDAGLAAKIATMSKYASAMKEGDYAGTLVAVAQATPVGRSEVIPAVPLPPPAPMPVWWKNPFVLAGAASIAMLTVGYFLFRSPAEPEAFEDFEDEEGYEDDDEEEDDNEDDDIPVPPQLEAPSEIPPASPNRPTVLEAVDPPATLATEIAELEEAAGAIAGVAPKAKPKRKPRKAVPVEAEEEDEDDEVEEDSVDSDDEADEAPDDEAPVKKPRKSRRKNVVAKKEKAPASSKGKKPRKRAKKKAKTVLQSIEKPKKRKPRKSAKAA